MMDFKETRRMLLETLEASAQERGFELVEVYISGSTTNPVVTIFLDDGKENLLENLCSANEWIEELVEAAAILPGSYTLEVSSPGINRPLRKLGDFERFAGQKVEIKIAAEKGQRSTYKGKLGGVENGLVIVETDKGSETIEYAAITKAHLYVDVDFKSLKGTKDNA